MTSNTHIKVFNKGKRTISGSYPNPNTKADEKTIEYALAPESHAAFPADEANKLRRLYPSEILSLDDVKATFEDKPEPVKEEAPAEDTISLTEAQAQQEAAVNAAVAAALKAQEKQHAEEMKAAIKAAAGDKGTTDKKGGAADDKKQPPAGGEGNAGDDANFAALNTIAKAAGTAPAGKKAS